MKRFRLCILILVVLAASTGCSMKKAATHVVAKVASDGMVAVEGEEDVAFARESAPALLKTLEVLRGGDPKDAIALTLLSQSFGQYAFGFLEEDMLAAAPGSPALARAKEQADLFYRRGREYGIAALARDGSIEKAFKQPFPEFQKAIAKLGKGAVPALFWTSFNWASYLNLHLDDPNTIADLPRIEAMIDRVLKLQPDFYYGSAHAFKGILAAMRPKMLGGNPALAKQEFDAAFAAAPNYLMTKVLFAQFYARQMQDPALFRSTLKEVEEADAKLLPAQRLANEMAKRRAKLLLGMEKKLF